MSVRLQARTYVGRKERRVFVRIAEHLPSWFFRSVNEKPRSSITRHPLDTDSVGTPVGFRIVNRQCEVLLLCWAEAVAISRQKPDRRVQEEMTYLLALIWWN